MRFLSLSFSLLLLLLASCASPKHSFAVRVPTGATLVMKQSVDSKVRLSEGEPEEDKSTMTTELRATRGGIVGEDALEFNVRIARVVGTLREGEDAELKTWDSASGKPAGEDFGTYLATLGLTYVLEVAADASVKARDLEWPKLEPEYKLSADIVKSLMTTDRLAMEMEGILRSLPRGAHSVGDSWPASTLSLSALAMGPTELTGRWHLRSVKGEVATVELVLDPPPKDAPITIKERSSFLTFNIATHMPVRQEHRVEGDVTLGDNHGSVRVHIVVDYELR